MNYMLSYRELMEGLIFHHGLACFVCNIGRSVVSMLPLNHAIIGRLELACHHFLDDRYSPLVGAAVYSVLL